MCIPHAAHLNEEKKKKKLHIFLTRQQLSDWSGTAELVLPSQLAVESESLKGSPLEIPPSITSYGRFRPRISPG